MRRPLAALSLLVLLALPAAAQARGSQRVLFEAPREMLSDDAALRSATLDEIRGFGVGWMRIVLYWNDVAPSRNSRHVSFDQTDPAAYDWSRYDRAIREADARGLRILLTLSGPVPTWATRGRRGHLWRPVPARFRAFSTAVGRHYGGVADAFSIWNEPNHPGFLRPQWRRRHHHRLPESAQIYRRLFFAGAGGLRRGGAGRIPVLFGETAPRGTGHVVHPITFLRVAMCLNRRWHRGRHCHRLPADGFAHHAYTTRSGPYFVPRNRNDVTIGVLGRLNRALAHAGRAHAVRRGLPIWLTEFGIQSVPDRLLGVSERRQAEYRAIAERIAYYNKRVVAFSQYLMRDDLPRAGASRLARYGGFESGLRHSGGRAKTAYAGFRLPLVALRKSRRTVGLWGIVRPGLAKRRVTIEFRARRGGWHRLKHDRTGRRGAWTTRTRYRRGRRYRVRWVAPGGHRYVSPPTRVYRRP